MDLNHHRPRKSWLDCIPDHPLNSDLVTRLKNVLEAGDGKSMVDLLCNEVKHMDAIIELSNDDWMKAPTAQLHPLVLVGLWPLEYTRELTNPLCISASHGHTDCLQHLLFCGADPNAAPGGRSALHEACEKGHTNCTKLLLEYKANPNFLSDDDQAPLHLCTSQNTLGCAKALVRFGALVNLPGTELQETPLHIAAKHGLYDHMHLYLSHSAIVDRKNSMQETALSVACREANNQESYLRVCKLLLGYGADANTVDEELKTPLHKACRNAHHGLVQLLLQRKADVNAIDYNGAYPMSCILQAAFSHKERQPHLTVQILLNHGSQKIWPTAFVKVLKSCATEPQIIDILFNSYPHLPISENWVNVIPKEDFQRHQLFYESFLNQRYKVRSLQHLCRCAIRKRCSSQCHSLIPFLPVPTVLQSYLLLEANGELF